jgi:lysyl-tRNA synthetase class 2
LGDRAFSPKTEQAAKGAAMPTTAAPINDIRYEQAHMKLFVRFADGDEYVYVGVPGDAHRSFLRSKSREQHFALEISGRYPFNKVG